MTTPNNLGPIATVLTLSLLTGSGIFTPLENATFMINSQHDREIKLVKTNPSKSAEDKYRGNCGLIYLNEFNSHILKLEKQSTVNIFVDSITENKNQTNPTILIKSLNQSTPTCFNYYEDYHETHSHQFLPGSYTIWIGNKGVNGDVYQVEIKAYPF